MAHQAADLRAFKGLARALRQAVEIDPRNPAALLGLGRSQVKLRLFKPALETLRSLTKADPKGISGFLALARAYEEEFISSSDKAATARNLETALGTGADRAGKVTKILGENGQAVEYGQPLIVIE